jgi:hypothetical protein
MPIMFGPNDPGYSAATIRAYQSHPERWYAHHGHARTLVGCALGHVVVGTVEDLHQAKRAVSRAIQLFMKTGMTRDQAIDQVLTFAQMLGSLE